MKPYLLRSETLPFANPYFVNRTITINKLRNHLSINTLRKTSKIASFSTEGQLVQKDGLNLRPKFEFSFTIFLPPCCRIQIIRQQGVSAFIMSYSEKTTNGSFASTDMSNFAKTANDYTNYQFDLR